MIVQIWQKLTDPHSRLTQIEQQSQARLLASLFFALLVIGALLIIINTSMAEASARWPIFAGGIVTLVSILISYAISRTRHYRLSLFPFTVGFVSIVIVSAIQQPTSILLPVYLIIPVLVWSVFFPLRTTTLFALIILIINGLLVRIVNKEFSYYLIEGIQLYLVILGAVLIITHQRNQIEKIRQNRLLANEARLQSYFDNANDWIFILDTNGRMSYVNQQMCITSGYTAAELIGQDPIAFLAPKSDKHAREVLQKILLGQAASHLEVDLPLRNGRTIQLEIRGRILEQDGKVVGTLHIARDITERRQAEQAEREQRQIAEALQTIAATLNSTLDLDEVLDHVLNALNNVLPHDVADIKLIQNGIGHIVRHHGYEKFDSAEAVTHARFIIAETPNLHQMTENLEPIAISDTHAYVGWVTMPGLEWVRSVADTPIVLNGQCIGFLHVASRTPGFFAHKHAVRLMAFAQHVANAIRNARLYQTEQQRRVVAETLHQASAVLNATLSLDDVLTRILEELGRALPFDSASVQQREKGVLLLRAVKGFPEPEKLLNQVLPIDPLYPNAYVVTQRQALAVEDVVTAYPHFQDQSDTYQSAAIRTWLGVPLIVNDEVIGVVTIDRNEVRPYTADEIALATTFANHAAIALHNARLYEQLARYNETLEAAVIHRTIELQHTTDQVEAILTNSPDAILLLRDDFQIELNNPAFLDLFGYDKSEIGMNFPACLSVPQDTIKFMHALNLAAQAGQHTRIEFIAQRKNKTTFDADMALAPICQEGEVLGIVCSIRDITTLKEIERIKDDFVSNVSHELRTPIANLKLHHDLLRLNPQKQEKYIAQLGREINRLNTIVENLLYLSRLDQGRINWQISNVNLQELAQQYVTDRILLAQEKDITLSYVSTPDPPAIRGDANLLSQVVSILLTNAINYTPEGGQVTLRIRQRETEDGEQWLGVSVTDTGPGIPEGEQGQIFERFYRGTVGHTSGKPGTGLGLSIANEIIKWHQGEIEVDSNGIAGEGATFTIWLSVNRSPTPVL